MSVLESIKAWAREYSRGREPQPFEREGVTYYMVGHNASHFFSVGLDAEGNIWRLSQSEEYLDEETERYKTVSYADKCASLDDVGYMGHY